jgi:hypothetical protein
VPVSSASFDLSLAERLKICKNCPVAAACSIIAMQKAFTDSEKPPHEG